VNEDIINRVSSSQLITLDLADYIPKGERVQYDLKDNLFQGLILREKDFRSFIKEKDWSEYKGKHVAVHCSADAIIPKWAYMLLVTKMLPFATTIVHGDLNDLERDLLIRSINHINPEDYKDKKLVIKGCGEKEIYESAYMEIVLRLQPYVASIMYGEPCSTVPVFKKPRK
jgi:hypothetical protein